MTTVHSEVPIASTPRKSPTAFRTIAEVADELQLPAHVLRFWESKFPQIKPLKRRGGRRYYRPEDIDLLRHIRTLLHTDGYTIRGVQRLLRESGSRQHADAGRSGGGEIGDRGDLDADRSEAADVNGDSLVDILEELEALRDLLRAHGF